MQGSAETHRLEDEHAVVRVQQLGDQQLEELLLDAARVDALLADEVHAQRLEKVLRPLSRNLIQRVLRSGALRWIQYIRTQANSILACSAPVTFWQWRY